MKSLLDQVTSIIIKLGIYVIGYKYKFSSSIIYKFKRLATSPQQMTLHENHATNCGKSFFTLINVSACP